MTISIKVSVVFFFLFFYFFSFVCHLISFLSFLRFGCMLLSSVIFRLKFHLPTCTVFFLLLLFCVFEISISL